MLDKDTALAIAKVSKIFNQKLDLLCERYRDFKDDFHKNFNALEIIELDGMISGMQMQNPSIPMGFWFGITDDNTELTCIRSEGKLFRWDGFDDVHNNHDVIGQISYEARVYIRERLDKFDDMAQEVEDYKATVEVMSDKELYDTIKNTDENTELYDEDDIKWECTQDGGED